MKWLQRRVVTTTHGSLDYFQVETMKLLTIRSMPVAPVSVCGASKDGFFHDKWRRRDLKVSQWLHGVTQTARSTSVWTVLIDSGAAAGPWWVIGWLFFLPPSLSLLGQTKVLAEQRSHRGLNKHQQATSQLGRHVHTLQWEFARKFRSLSRRFIGANKSETWFYLSASCQTV